MGQMKRRRPRGDAQSWIGRVIDQRYRIVRPLGEGAMGAVFVAEHLTLPKQVALKVVRSELSAHKELHARFAREAMAGSKIDHPSIVAALDYGPLEEGGAYLVMPLVPGRRLTEVMESEGRLGWARAAELGAQIADALAAAWAQGFVHRDLKPDNILIEDRAPEGPLAHVLDFGVAKLIEGFSGIEAPASASGEQLTKEGTIIGTPGYMAPEQALGRSASHASDLYSLGVILWEAIAGEPMWTGESAHAIMRAQLRESRPSLQKVCDDPTLPRALDALVTSLVAVRPEQRPQSAAEVRDLLRSMLETGSEIEPPRAPSPVPAVMPSPATPSKGISPATAAVLGVCGAVLLVGLVLLVGPFRLSVELDRPASGADGVSSPPGASGDERALELLDRAATCEEKRQALASLPRPLESRVRRALERLSAQPETGCGPRGNSDCLACLRPNLRELLADAPR